MKSKLALTILVCAMFVVLPLMTPSPSSLAQTSDQNLLTDGDFESASWPLQNGIGELQLASGWSAWYLDSPPAYVKKPINCDDKSKPDCYWMRPKFFQAVIQSFPNRIHGGSQAQGYSSYGRMHEAGLYQRVTGLTAGTTVRFSIYIQAWQCTHLGACGRNGIRSDEPADMHLRVGIDPYGGTDPLSSNIVWSSEQPAFDHWVQFAVQAKAQGDAVTVFTHSRAEWDWARTNNDVYLDDASLVVTTPGTPGATSQPAATEVPGTAGPTNTPAPTRTPRTDGAVVHIVGQGDTLYGISLEYDVPLDDLYKLNNLTRDSILNIGQEIIVKPGTGQVVAPQATATAKPKTTATSPVTPTVAPPTATPIPPTATPISSGLCLSAFEDLNANTIRDGNEPGLAGVTFVIVSGGNEVARYQTDGSGKPYCLTQLPPGAYSVQIGLPTGYIASLEQTDVALALGQRVELAIAGRQGEKATPTVEPTVQATAAAQPGPSRTNTLILVLVLFAIVFLVLIGIAISIVRRRR